MRWKVGAVLGVVLVAALIGGGCGGGDGPSSVSADDLQEEGGFWLGLEDDLKRELATICHDKQVKEAPDPGVVTFLQGLDVDSYVAHIDKQFESDEGATIESACEAAKVSLASESFQQIAPHLSE